MRELKFRAWHLIENRWAMENEIESIILVNTFYHFGRFELDEKSGNGLAKDLGTTLEVMQYTGIKDRNGKEIYEGDIVKGETDIFSQYTGKVSFAGGRYVVDGLGNYSRIREELVRSYEIIGNIHEHQHLLKEASL